MNDFYRRLDERMIAERNARIFRDRPENLHDYQGCVKDEWVLIYDTASRMPNDTGILSGTQIMALIDQFRSLANHIRDIHPHACSACNELARIASEVCECGHSRRCHTVTGLCDDGCLCSHFKAQP